MRKMYKKAEKTIVTGVFLLCFGSTIALTGCNGAGEETKTQAVTTTGNEITESVQVSLAEIYAQIETEVEIPSMVKLKDNYIINYYGIDVTLLEDYIFYNAEDVIYADTVILMKLKNNADISELKVALETMMEHKKLELENYLPEQYNIVKNSEIEIAGNYMYLVISEKEDAIDAIIAQTIH